MTNIYWPVYRNLEKSVDELTFSIHICDAQLGVYSSKTTDLILRAAAEIESLSKELYKSNGGKKAGDCKFDDVAIRHLNGLWSLEKKRVIISSPNCFQSDRILFPFLKNEVRTASAAGKQTYSWNNAYQNLKHDRAGALEFGSIKYLFDIMAALYVLNLYYKKEVIRLNRDGTGLGFPENLGSTLFSVELAVWRGYGPALEYFKADNFDAAIYYVAWTEETKKTYLESVKIRQEKFIEVMFKHPKVIEFAAVNDIKNIKGNIAWHVLGKDEYIHFLQQVNAAAPIEPQHPKYEALLNTHAF